MVKRIMDSYFDDCLEKHIGTLERIIYLSDDKSYTVAEFMTMDDSFVICGYLPDPAEFLEYEIHGRWKHHPKYGRQFSLELASIMRPEQPEVIERFLASGLISGIGEKTASLIVEEFGENSLNIIENQPEELLKIKGIGAKTLATIIESYNEQVYLKSNMLFFQKVGISNLMGGAIIRELGPNSSAIISENPFVLVDRVRGFGFKKADQIAQKLGMGEESPDRINACIIHLLNEESKKGHTYSYKEEILSQIQDYNISYESGDDAIYRLDMGGKIFMTTQYDDGEIIISLSNLENLETQVAQKTVELLYNSKPINPNPSFVIDFEFQRSIELDIMQKQAIELAKTDGVFIITGGPGTGKTTIISAIIDLYESCGRKVALCAPTGRAAQRMSSVSGRQAKTIHRLLESNGREFARNKDFPVSEDVIIVDEVSMIDIFLMYRLLDAIKCGSALIMVGDKDQLPSVGAGSVLRDLLKTEQIKSVKLEKIFRQSDDSSIASNAHLINAGEMPICNDGRDFYFLNASSDEAAPIIADLVTKRLPEAYGLDPNEIQVLGLKYKGIDGVNRLNEILQERLNPLPQTEINIGYKTFRMNDKVMQIANNYDIKWISKLGGGGSGVFNGDIGKITQIDKEKLVVEVSFDDGRVAEYDPLFAADLVPAYAITVHKSQGSEFSCVVMPIFKTWNMSYRNLLYTAITRAKNFIVLVGSKDALRHMVENVMIDKRRSKLHNKLKDLFDAYS